MLVCSTLILKYVNSYNISAVYSDASDLHCDPLLDSIQEYITANIETLLESRFLDDVRPRLIKQLSGYIRNAQQERMPHARSSRGLDLLMEKHRDWLDAEDFPAPIIRTAPSRGSPRLSPKTARHRRTKRPLLPLER